MPRRAQRDSANMAFGTRQHPQPFERFQRDACALAARAQGLAALRLAHRVCPAAKSSSAATRRAATGSLATAASAACCGCDGLLRRCWSPSSTSIPNRTASTAGCRRRHWRRVAARGRRLREATGMRHQLRCRQPVHRGDGTRVQQGAFRDPAPEPRIEPGPLRSLRVDITVVPSRVIAHEVHRDPEHAVARALRRDPPPRRGAVRRASNSPDPSARLEGA